MKWIIRVFLLLLLTWSCLAADKPVGKEEEPKPARSIDELHQQVEKILKDTHTNGVSIAIVHKNGLELGFRPRRLADLASNRAATADTLFRIGSTSKTFISLSILMLVDQGKLSLDDPLHTLAPEVWFDNPWESSDPVRVVNLLEHTTGWDDLHFREYAKQAPDSMSLREGLDYDHHSRTSRWPPGTRMAYCNAGPAVAAYVIEKLTGQKFEDFVQRNSLQSHRDEDCDLLRAGDGHGDHALSPRRQDSFSVLAHHHAPSRGHQRVRQRHGGVSGVSRRGAANGKQVVRPPTSIVWRVPRALGPPKRV